MKKLITFVAIGIIASLFFSSCRSNTAITKRHYNNGYYIAFNKGKHSAATVKPGEKTAQVRAKEMLPVFKNETVKNNIIENRIHNVAPVQIATNNEKALHKAVSPQYVKKSLNLNTPVIEGQDAQSKQTKFAEKKISSDSVERDGLSLLWIVILVILILWAIGLLAGGFGLGGLINILLVVALVLLILWLLRIL